MTFSNFVILAVDVGTSSLKGVVYDRQGGIRATASHRYPISEQVLPPGWAETDPHIWWEAFLRVMTQLQDNHADFSDLQIITFTGQMHTAVLLDEKYEVISPTILWLDRRAAQETAELQRVFSLPPYQLNSTYTLPKLVWLARNNPHVLNRARHLVWPKDYLRFRLTGEIATDYTEAGGAALLDWNQMKWAVDRLEWGGISPSLLPELHQPTDIAGRILPEIADRFKINQDVKVLIGAGDVLALVAASPPREGRLTCSMGSSSMVFYPLEDGQVCSDTNNRIYTYPLLSYPLIGGVSSTSGASITWAAKTLFGELPFDDAIKQALNSPPGADGLFFLPFLSGERSPFWNDALRGSFYGLTLNHDRADMLRAVLEGVAYSLRYLCDVFREAGLKVSEIALAGGANNIQGMSQILSSVNQIPVSVFTGQETVTHGLYAYACQVLEKEITFGSALKRTFTQSPEIIHPERTLEATYRSQYEKYCKLADFANTNL